MNQQETTLSQYLGRKQKEVFDSTPPPRIPLRFKQKIVRISDLSKQIEPCEYQAHFFFQEKYDREAFWSSLSVDATTVIKAASDTREEEFKKGDKGHTRLDLSCYHIIDRSCTLCVIYRDLKIVGRADIIKLEDNTLTIEDHKFLPADNIAQDNLLSKSNLLQTGLYCYAVKALLNGYPVKLNPDIKRVMRYYPMECHDCKELIYDKPCDGDCPFGVAEHRKVILQPDFTKGCIVGIEGVLSLYKKYWKEKREPRMNPLSDAVCTNCMYSIICPSEEQREGNS